MSGACFSPEAPPAVSKERIAGSQPPRIEVLRDPVALARLIPQWEDLAASALEPNPFYEHWMLLPALESFAKDEDIRVVAVWLKGKLSGLFPLQRARRYKGLPVSALSAWRHRHCLLCTPLVRAAGAADTLAALVGWLRTQAPLLELN